jgi:predicted Abi (CAAX) family protease
MKKIFALSFVPLLLVGGAGCLPKRSVSSSQNTVVDPASQFRPVTQGREWSGQIFLPARESRLENSIFMKVASAPEEYNNVIGKMVRLHWARGTGSATQFLPNIAFNKEELAKAQQGGNVVPLALDGWDKVGPLESLAAARCKGEFVSIPFQNGQAMACAYNRIDRIFVKVLPNTFQAATSLLYVGEEPTVVAGTHYALVKNIRKVKNTQENGTLSVYAAEVYNKGGFHANAVEFGVEEEFGKRPNFTFNEINRSPAASLGWYLYADREGEGKDARFVAKAIEPRALVRVNGEYGRIAGTANGEEFLRFQEGASEPNAYLSQNALTRAAFANLENNFRKVRILPGASKAPLSNANPIEKISVENTQRTFRVGEMGLVVHLFHWITDPAGKKDVQALGLVTGHYSYGMYEVVREPITGELQFDVVYRQVYAQGSDAVISSKVSRSEYMGNFRRGWSNSIATSDVLVRAPWLDNSVDTSSDTKVTNMVPLKIFDDTLSLILHAYRTGSGDGISSVTPWASCVQDSSQALFIAIKRIEKALLASRGAAYCQNPDYGRICGLAEKLKVQFDSSDIFNNAADRGDWLNNSINFDARRTSSNAQNAYESLRSYKTALPRNAFNLFLSAMLKQGANLVLMDNVQIGGFWTPAQKSTGFIPTPATTIVEVVKKMIAEGGQIKEDITIDEIVQMIFKQEGINSIEEINRRFPGLANAVR